ncbi:hypothetical protein A2397_05075 [Candidatus Amesbacteria bacterium RIFOXYB1_FULL_44_23]|uniref:Methyltransferase domain-containing protein n=1 Tax=Candidatus Amesbacteria bacterium RIFOXYB1_FULL_44_23 TaxID=1797263 RepID=A0A1F4ZR53_9BACT|nr:MAG: hypothetical protein A2397_05075 [Candidatus Amesbacteria bacterium RIFOXYB1_FULL_44_23]
MANLVLEKNIDEFNRDVQARSGYEYTATDRLSCRIANEHLSEMVHAMCGDLTGKTIADVGCGDGTYTVEFLKFKPKSILGIDPARVSIRSAKRKFKNPKLTFKTGNIYTLSSLKKRFDVVVVRGVLHHVYQPEKAISQLSRIAKILVIAEPNGYNPILKLIEKTSSYHRAHEEKSYPAAKVNKWVTDNNGRVESSMFGGLVPFFCPDPIVNILKKLEPVVENTVAFNRLLTASYICKCSFTEK